MWGLATLELALGKGWATFIMTNFYIIFIKLLGLRFRFKYFSHSEMPTGFESLYVSYNVCAKECNIYTDKMLIREDRSWDQSIKKIIEFRELQMVVFQCWLRGTLSSLSAQGREGGGSGGRKHWVLSTIIGLAVKGWQDDIHLFSLPIYGSITNSGNDLNDLFVWIWVWICAEIYIFVISELNPNRMQFWFFYIFAYKKEESLVVLLWELELQVDYGML